MKIQDRYQSTSTFTCYKPQVRCNQIRCCRDLKMFTPSTNEETGEAPDGSLSSSMTRALLIAISLSLFLFVVVGSDDVPENEGALATGNFHGPRHFISAICHT